MMATTAGRADARAESRGGANSNTLGHRDHRPTPAHISAVSLFGFFRAEFVERPRIFRLDGLGLAGYDDDGAVELDLVAGDRNRGFSRRSSNADECRLAGFARGAFEDCRDALGLGGEQCFDDRVVDLAQAIRLALLSFD